MPYVKNSCISIECRIVLAFLLNFVRSPTPPVVVVIVVVVVVVVTGEREGGRRSSERDRDGWRENNRE